MTFASALFCFGFTLLIALGIFALGLVFAASFFAIVAAGTDTIRFFVRIGRCIHKQWLKLGSSGRQFIFCWLGILASASLFLYRPHAVSSPTPFDGFDLLGVALCLPAAAQIADRLGRRRGADS